MSPRFRAGFSGASIPTRLLLRPSRKRSNAMYQGWAEMGGGNIDVAKEHALYEGAFEAMKQLPPGVYSPDELVRRLPQIRSRYTIVAGGWRMNDHGLVELTPGR